MQQWPLTGRFECKHEAVGTKWDIADPEETSNVVAKGFSCAFFFFFIFQVYAELQKKRIKKLKKRLLSSSSLLIIYFSFQ